jgi:hypothetical protein
MAPLQAGDQSVDPVVLRTLLGQCHRVPTRHAMPPDYLTTEHTADDD